MKREIENGEYWRLIWEKFKRGDRLAFEKIYNEFSDSLFAYGSKIATDRDMLKDAIQDTFIAIYNYGTELKNPESLEFYLFKTLKHILYRKIKKESKKESLKVNQVFFNLNFDLETQMIESETYSHRMNALQKILESLDDSKRELIFLKFYSSLTYEDMAKVLGMNPDAVKKQIYRLIESLRSQLGDELLELLFLCYKTQK